jgi:arylsulfatase A-like enzyme
VDHRSATIASAADGFLSHAPKRPFFLAVGFADTHREFTEPGPGEDARYCRPPMPLPDTPETRQDMAAFQASARLLDGAIGTVLDSLEANGLAESTLVVCTTDHGIAFPQMKCNVNDHGTGVMLMLRGPGGFLGGKVVDALVGHVDLYPTICDLVGIDRPDWLEGESVLPLVNGEATEIHDELFAEVNYHCPYEPMRSVRTRRYRYIRRYAEYPCPMPSNIDNSPSKDLLMRYGLAERRVSCEELYDLVYDPNEACNLAKEPALNTVLSGMRQRLRRWMEETDDPLLRGPVPLPPGAVVSKPADVSPMDIWTYVDKPRGYG